MNTALSLEIAGKKKVPALMVGRPDLSLLPLLKRKNWLHWGGDADEVARRLDQMMRPLPPVPACQAAGRGAGQVSRQVSGQGAGQGAGVTSTPVVQGGGACAASGPSRRTWRSWLFGN